jgi:chemotaxis-related protein WspB
VLYSQFFIDQDRYVISADNIVEIVPYVSLKSSPQLPDYAAGLINYHSEAIPVIDLCRLLIDRPCKKRLSTRILIVEKKDNSMNPLLLGFMVEKSTEMIRLDDNQFKYSVMRNADALIDGPVIEFDGGLVTKISVASVFKRLDKRFFHLEEAVSHGTAQ